jgi:molecular chaperone DnaJ
MKRQFYDVNGFYTDGVLEPRGANADWGFSFQGFDFGSSSPSEFSEIFSQVFGGRASRRQPERGQDLEYQVLISFEESLRGRNATVSVLRKDTCGACGGTGQAPGSRDWPCAGCNGIGKTTRSKGHLQFAVT